MMAMKRSEVHARYQAEVASIEQARARGEHIQGISMAMNEARRWLDRELSSAEPDDNEETRMTKIDPTEAWRNGYNGRELLGKHGWEEDGIWRAYGEDPNPDLGGHHHQPKLGVFQGRLCDVVAYVVTLPNWASWGGGGRIEAYRPPNIKRITKDSLREMEDLRQRRKQLEKELDRINRELGED
jgi:hypothetical protein